MLTIIMPLSGRGRAFQEKGYTFPKPLIEVGGMPLIEIVVGNLVPAEPHKFVFVCRREVLDQYALADVLQLISPGCRVVSSYGETGGALCSVLLGIEHLDPEQELIIANGDQYIDSGIDAFIASARNSGVDGSVLVFPSTHPKWSYARISESGDVEMIAEKRPISRNATAGIYYFRCGRDFLQGAERMILKGTKTAAEFYVAPVFNELILAGKRVSTFHISRKGMHSLGTPEDLEVFAKHINNQQELNVDADA
jgi:NDP-sugar pyrophosphorylase family protein